MKKTNALFSSLCIVFAAAYHAFANNSSGPLAVVSLFSPAILMVVLTYAGGQEAYSILNIEQVTGTSDYRKRAYSFGLNP